MKNLYFVYYCLEEDVEWTSSNEAFEIFFDYNKAVDFARDVKGKVYDADITPNGGFEVGRLLYDCTESTDLWEEVWEEMDTELKEDLADLEEMEFVDEEEEF